ncbi:MAG TPA: MscL family protein, partial [Salinimicrobium sp.]|nr:MscL family protein [Salinimicrobium sp.]
MGFFRDFKSFLFKQDIISLATAFIIAAALKTVINSVVDDVIMPFAGLL